MGWPFAWDDHLRNAKRPSRLLEQLSPLKFNLIEDHSLRGDEPDREANHKGPERNGATDECSKGAACRIASCSIAVAHCEIGVNRGLRVSCWEGQCRRFKLASICVRFHA